MYIGFKWILHTPSSWSFLSTHKIDSKRWNIRELRNVRGDHFQFPWACFNWDHRQGKVLGWGWGKMMLSYGSWVSPPPLRCMSAHVCTFWKAPREVAQHLALRTPISPGQIWDAWQRQCILYELAAENTNHDYLWQQDAGPRAEARLTVSGSKKFID